MTTLRKTAKPLYIVGIDEAGRGPIAGPVAVGVCMAKAADWRRLVRMGEKATGFALHDSKKLTRIARERWYAWLVEQRAAGSISFAVGMSAAAIIDRRGIVPAIRSAMVSALRRALASNGVAVATPEQCDVRLDGALRAPAEFVRQRTIIKGDETEPLISLASIAAKVERDRRMRSYALAHPAYGFDIHKGYGTRLHYAALGKAGASILHRRSFLKGRF